jgi:hypothetical protein
VGSCILQQHYLDLLWKQIHRSLIINYAREFMCSLFYAKKITWQEWGRINSELLITNQVKKVLFTFQNTTNFGPWTTLLVVLHILIYVHLYSYLYFYSGARTMSMETKLDLIKLVGKGGYAMLQKSEHGHVHQIQKQQRKSGRDSSQLED